jgi:hypothetical protein
MDYGADVQTVRAALVSCVLARAEMLRTAPQSGEKSATIEDKLEFLYGSYGRKIEIVGKSETMIFVRQGRGRRISSYTVSRSAFERNGKVKSGWDSDEWLFLNKEQALEHSARESERRMQKEREQQQRWQREQEAQRKRQQEAEKERYRKFQEETKRIRVDFENWHAEWRERWQHIWENPGVQHPQRHAAPPTPEEMHRLKMEMVAAHPDKGGTADAFIKARAAYTAAKQASAS